MPKRTDIKTILLLGSGPIVIGQGCEFDYSGTQACKALKAEGFRVVLVNSNPATIMTDPEMSDRTYIEPITPAAVRKILQKQRDLGDPIDAILPTLGGQTALNCACALFDDGTLAEFGVEMIGADRKVIHRAEDRQAFKEIVEGLGLKMPKAKTVKTMPEALAFLEEIGLPAIIRPAFTLGGTGGGIAYNREEYEEICGRGMRASMIGQVQIDQSVLGWKEYELEVVRDKKDNAIIVCGIENIDPMGVHTGDSITVAPILTLTDKEYQAMRDAALAIMRAVGVETGGSNVQFAVNPNPAPGPDGKRPFEMIVVEMNPRVSRSSALASKATGFPIAKIAAKLAIGYTLDELRNDITGTTSACFEPAIDYVVTKIPRWTFEKFPEADETLTTQMKSVGEGMAIGRTFLESFQKAIRSMEVKRYGYGLDRNDKWLTWLRAVATQELVQTPFDIEASPMTEVTEGEGQRTPEGDLIPQIRTADGELVEWPIPDEKLSRKLVVPGQGRLYYVRYAFKLGWTAERIFELTKIDPWFLDQLQRLVEFEDVLMQYSALEEVPRGVMAEAKSMGYSDAQLANLYLGRIDADSILKVRARRKELGIEPVFKLVDTCAAEFEARTPYYYSTYEEGIRGSGDQGIKGLGSIPGSHDPSIPSAESEIRVSDKKKVIIVGGGPNRIGQGIEFDYCCVHASFAARELGFESVMINSNPETVSTDYDTSDLLFFEPLTLEDVLNVMETLNGVPLRTPNKLPIDSDHLAEFKKLGIRAEHALSHTHHQSGVDGSKYGYVVRDQSSGELWELSWGLKDFKGGVNLTREFPTIAARLEAQWASSTGHLLGAIVQFGGQTPLNLSHGLTKAGVPIIGTSVDSIDLAEDRDRFDVLLSKLGFEKPPSGIARTFEQAKAIAARVGYPVLVRPSYVLGGRGMEICADERALADFVRKAAIISDLDDAPVLIDRFLSDATEVDVDVVADFDVSRPVDDQPAGSQAIVCSVMEHIEQAGVHSGDSSCVIPPWSLSAELVGRIKEMARTLAKHLRVRGLMNLQLAIKPDGSGREQIYVLEVNPRASRTVPFVGKATRVPWPRIAAKVMMGKTLAELGVSEPKPDGMHAVKVSVFPFSKFPGVDVVLGPEMRSTGEVMGYDPSWPIAFAKGLMGAGVNLPTSGNVFLSVRQSDRPHAVRMARELVELGLKVYTTTGTSAYLGEHGIQTVAIQKIDAGVRPNVIDLMTNGQIQLVINTPTRTGWGTDEGKIRSAAVRLGIPMITTCTGGLAAVTAIRALQSVGWGVGSLQDAHRSGAVPGGGKAPVPAR
ncbi:MAG: carbamoyl-phosphate synthase large subunit [Phycisphaerales bacterium]|nr:carbamoyl-phosphate synthase large subunit [Phycisphaerales bacterium]